MPLGDAHKKQQRKNWVMFALLVGFVALMVAVTVLKASGMSDGAA
jgi:hypothetical protein